MSQESAPGGALGRPPRERGFKKKGRLQRHAVAGETADDLHAKREAGSIGQSRYVDARRAEQRPEPVERGSAGRAQPLRGCARRRRGEKDVEVRHEIGKGLPRAARGTARFVIAVVVDRGGVAELLA